MRFKKRYIIETVVVLAVLVLLVSVMLPRFLEAQNINTPQNFPDPVFRELVESFMQVEPGGKFSKREAYEKTGALNSVSYYAKAGFQRERDGRFISDLTGIEFFHNITGLHCPGNNLSTINLSGNTKLEKLDCSNNNITGLDLTHNSALIELNCSSNPISNLNLTNQPALMKLTAYSLKLGSIDLSQNTQLTEIHISNNDIAEIDLTNNTALQIARLSHNHIKKLPALPANPLFSALDISYNDITNDDCGQVMALSRALPAPRFIYTPQNLPHGLFDCIAENDASTAQ